MSGHSKWSTIKHKKAANDKVKGSVFTKMAKGITVAVKKGGGIGDPEMNFALRLAVDKARAVNMPKENIDRAIAKGIGRGGDELAELSIEGFAPEGVAVIVEAVTDNSNRTIAELRSLMEKHGGTMGEIGSVAYLFERCGEITYRGVVSDESELELIDLGLLEIEQDQGEGRIYTQANSLMKIVERLRSLGMEDVEGALTYRPLTLIKPKNEQKVREFLEIVAEHDDVQEVYAALG